MDAARARSVDARPFAPAVGGDAADAVDLPAGNATRVPGGARRVWLTARPDEREVRQRIHLLATAAVRCAGARRSEVAGPTRCRDRAPHGRGGGGVREPDLARGPRPLRR